MATKNTEEKVNVTGLDMASNKQEAEYDLLTALLEAADYKTDEENFTEVEIKRNGKFMFAVHIRPLSEEDIRFARKKATSMMPNPTNRKLPQIEKEFDNGKFKSWMIYLSTTEEDQVKIWGNKEVMSRFAARLPVDTIDILLKAGEKNRLMDEVFKISGFDEDGNPVDEETEDEVSF